MSQQILSIEGVLDLATAMSNLDGDVELLQEIIDIFVTTGQVQLESLADGIAAGDVDKVAVESHGMKGGASNFCASQFVAAALQLELLAKQGTLEGAENLLAEMQASFIELQEVAVVINWSEVAASWQR